VVIFKELIEFQIHRTCQEVVFEKHVTWIDQ